MIVDNNMHWLPETMFSDDELLHEVLRIPHKSTGLYSKFETIAENGNPKFIIEQPKGYNNLNYTIFDVDAAARIKSMDICGVDKAILRVPCLEEWASLETCRKFNDMMHETVKKSPGRIYPIAIVPPYGDKYCLYELERCVKELGCVAVEMAAHYGDLHMDQEEFRPHLKKIAELGVPVTVHHTPLPAAHQSIYQNDSMRLLLGRCFAQLTCLMRNVYSGLFDELPELKVVHSYMAGGFFAFGDFLGASKNGIGGPQYSKIPVPAEFQEPARRSSHGYTREQIKSWYENNIYYDMCPSARKPP